MKIPTHLKIGGHNIKVMLKELPEDIAGASDVHKNEIHINSRLPQSQREASLIHEIFHFLNWTFDSQPLGHALLDAFAEQFYQVLTDNKMV